MNHVSPWQGHVLLPLLRHINLSKDSLAKNLSPLGSLVTTFTPKIKELPVKNQLFKTMVKQLGQCPSVLYDVKNMFGYSSTSSPSSNANSSAPSYTSED